MKLEDMVKGLTATNCSKSSNCSSSKPLKVANLNTQKISKSSNCSKSSKDNTSNIYIEEGIKDNSFSLATATPATLATLDRQRPLPFFAHGGIVIPFNSDPRFHWWRGGQSARETETEVKRRVH